MRGITFAEEKDYVFLRGSACLSVSLLDHSNSYHDTIQRYFEEISKEVGVAQKSIAWILVVIQITTYRKKTFWLLQK